MFKKISIKGNYRQEPIQILTEANASVENTTVAICVHGLYGEAGDAGSKSVKLGEALCDAIRGVVYISTSRDWSLYAKTDDRSAPFAGKTFAQERKDVRDAIDLVIKKSNQLFGIDSKDIRFWVIGNSMGGSLVSMIASSCPEIEKIALCGSGIRPSSNDLPILSTYPSVDYIRKETSMFTGEVLHMRGGLDAIVDAQAQEELYESFTNAKSKRSIVVGGANHNFSKLFDKDKDKAYSLYVKNIVNFLLR